VVEAAATVLSALAARDAGLAATLFGEVGVSGFLLDFEFLI
jgi:hypothetical protein